MMAEIKILTLLELRSLWGVNRFLCSRDKKERRTYLALCGAFCLVAAMAALYTGGLSVLLVPLGLGELAPGYLAAIASLIIFAFGFFKGGGTLFSLRGYDVLTALPVRAGAIVAARFLGMYAEDLALTLIVMVPGLGAWGCLTGTGLEVWGLALAAILLIPVLPLLASTVLGTLVLAISSRMKRKNLAKTGLTLVLLVGFLLLSFQTGLLAEELDLEAVKLLLGQGYHRLGSMYPPAMWLGTAMTGQGRYLLLTAAVTVLAALGAWLGISRCFHPICRRLSVNSARHDFVLGALSQKNVLGALVRREARRYFSSTIYVTNTIIGPILGVLLSAGLLLAGADTVQAQLPVDIMAMLPYVLAGVFCLMSTTSVAVGMEGREFWIVKSLPVLTKQVVQSKLLLYYGLTFPCWALSEVLLLLALKPGLVQGLSLVGIPGLWILFTGVLGIYVNLKLPNFQWQKEETVVKQSASAGLAGLGGGLLAFPWMALPMLLPEGTANLAQGALCLGILALTGLLYRKCCQTSLERL